MTAHIERQPFSSSIGDYLKAIWTAAGTNVASTKQVSEHLSIAPASVTKMFARLRDMGLVEYEPYQGASLTGEGRTEALRLLRRHRLIETFLLEHLGYSWQEVHEEAESLEHAVSDGFTERLAKFLGHPEHNPYGDPIPAADGALPPECSYPLSEATVGCRVRISKVSDEDPSVLDHLWQHRLVPGRLLNVIEARALDGVIAVEDENGTFHVLGGLLVKSIFIQSLPENRQ
jgi:DtxR family transcriptional regulator, Mn-dependent transcriptional regulator